MGRQSAPSTGIGRFADRSDLFGFDVIECLGVPGSGKTFFCRSLARLAEARGLLLDNSAVGLDSLSRARRLARKAASCLRAVLFRPVLTARLLGWCLAQDIGSTGRAARIALNGWGVIGFHARRGPLLLDQGGAQIFWALARHLAQQGKGWNDEETGIWILDALGKNRRIALIEFPVSEALLATQLQNREGWGEFEMQAWRASCRAQNEATAMVLQLLNRLPSGHGWTRASWVRED